MRVLRFCLGIMLGALVVPVLRADAAVLSLHDYGKALQHLREQLSVPQLPPDGAATIADTLPQTYTVQSNGEQFTVSLTSIADNLRQFAKSHTADNLDRARASVELLLTDAQAMEVAPDSSGAERIRLDEILARREFHDVVGETWWDRLKRRVQRFLWDALGAVFAWPAFPVVSRVILWAVIALSVVLLAYWVVRGYRETGTFPQLAGIPGAISERPWRDWEAEARSAAAEGRWRDAIHFSYWAGISLLEGQGLWRPDRARTPREYLQLLPASDAHHDSLAELTRKFETVWYGTEVANEQSFAATNELLERLGCR